MVPLCLAFLRDDRDDFYFFSIHRREIFLFPHDGGTLAYRVSPVVGVSGKTR